MQPAPDKHYPWDRETEVKADSDSEIVEIVKEEAEAKIELLATVQPFELFDERWLGVIAGLMVEEAYEEHEVIYRAGDPSDATYLISEGEVAIYTDTPGEPVQLMARLRAGDIFGEVGVLEHCCREASARASSNARVLRLEGIDLQRLGRANPAFGMKLVHRALLRSMQEPSRALELGQHHDVRIRIGSFVLLIAGDREPLRVELENLSVGGCCARGVPSTWHLYESTPISIRLEDGTELLEVCGRIAWRRDESVGIAFNAVSRGHGQQIERALELLLEPGRESVVEEPALPGWNEM